MHSKKCELHYEYIESESNAKRLIKEEKKTHTELRVCRSNSDDLYNFTHFIACAHI